MSSPHQAPNEALTPTKRALRALQEMQTRLDALERKQQEPIAIVGMGCRFPGAENLTAFWQMLAHGVDAVGEVPPERWDINRLYNPDAAVPGKIISRYGSFLSHLDRFDADFFGISAREAPHIDPRQRLVMEVAWEALENAGIPPDGLAGSDTGVFMAVLTNDYDYLVNTDPARVRIYTGIGVANSIVANRLSYFLDLHGPSLVVDTACSGSLTALHQACQSIHNGDASLALVGGVGVNLLPNADLFFSRAGSLSPDGHCKTFDSNADGMVRCEGCGIIVIKRLSQAVADGDHIHAVIRATAVNHDGHSNGIMAPNGAAQVAVLREAYRRAGIDPADVQYVEAHGTGTRLGDPIEVGSLATVLGERRPADRVCVLGSVKTNLGHPEAAAGVAGIIKVALAMQQRQIPPNLHFLELNPLIDAGGLPIHVPTALEPWPCADEPLIAGVNSFGFGGSNAHAVLMEAPSPPAPDALQADAAPRLLPLSARTPDALRVQIEQMHDFLARDGATVNLADLCYSATLRRTHFEYRTAVVGASVAEMTTRLQSQLTGDGPAPMVPLDEPMLEPDVAGRVVFAFPGQGSQWLQMGQRLLASEPIFRGTIEACDRLFRTHTDWSLLAELQADATTSRMVEIDIVQPALFAVQVALAALWRSWGIEPYAVVGQSLGEVAAAHVSGALSLADAVTVAFYRSMLLRRVAGKGQAAVVGLPNDDVESLLAEYDGALGVAGYSGPTSCLVSGDPDRMRHLLDRLAAEQIFHRLLVNVDAAAHSPQMDPLKGELQELLNGIQPRPTTVPFFSTVTGVRMDGETLDAAYWARNLREPFRFSDVVGDLIERGVRLFLEISAHATLCGAIRQNFLYHDCSGIALPSLMRDADERHALLDSLAALYSAGYPIDWRRSYPDGGRAVQLPTYPWQGERYWYDQLPGSGSSALHGGERQAGGHPLLGVRWQAATSPGQAVWELDLDVHGLHYLQDHGIQQAVVFPAAGYVEMALGLANELGSGGVHVVEAVEFERMLLLSESAPQRVQCVSTQVGRDHAEFAIYSRPAGQDGASDWVQHCHGRVRSEREAVAWSSVDVMGIRARCTERVDTEEMYEQLAARRLRYGPAFQAVTAVWRRPGEVLTRIQLPETVAAGAAPYVLHPVLLDACFQGVSVALADQSEETYVPGGIRRLECRHAPGDAAWCHIRLHADSESGAPELEADLDIVDDAGKVVARVEGLRLVRLGNESGVEATAADPESMLYELTWQPFDPVGSATAERGRWLILADGHGMGETLADTLTAYGEICTVIFAEREQQHGADAEHRMRALVGEWVAGSSNGQNGSRAAPVRGIIHLWSLDAAPFSDISQGAVDEMAQSPSRSILHLVQTLSKHDLKTHPQVWLVTRNAQCVVPDEHATIQVTQAPTWGMGRVLAREHPELWGGLVDLDASDNQTCADQLTALLLSERAEDQLALRDGRWHAARLAARAPTTRPADTLSFRRDGAYLITGGLTGVGWETARWMAERGARRLVLIGRTELPPRQEWTELPAAHPAAARVAAVRELEKLGVAVHVAALDISEHTQFAAFLAAYRAEGWPPIRGVVHSAAVLADQLMMRMDAQTFDAALRPKVQGALALHELLRDEPLDFFVIYSSMTALLGQIGQANYAAGNAFVDALAHWRRAHGQPGLSINWGPWAQIGLFARDELDQRAGLRGVTPIEPTQGMAALGILLQTDAAQAAVIQADWSQAPRSTLLVDLIAQSDGADGDVGADDDLLVDLLLAEPGERRARLENELCALAARVFRQDADRLQARKPLTTMGMDSIMAVELRNQVEARFGITLPIVDFFTHSIAQIAEGVAAHLDGDERLSELLDELEGMSEEAVSALLAVEGKEEAE